MLCGYLTLIFRHGVAGNETQEEDAWRLLSIKHQLEQREFLASDSIAPESLEHLRSTRQMLETTIQMIRHIDRPATLLGVRMHRGVAIGFFFGVLTVVFSVVVEVIF